MKKASAVLLVVGLIIVIGSFFYIHDAVNAADSDSVTVNPSGDLLSRWPMFVGSLFVVFSGIFYMASTITNGKAQH